MIKQFTDQNFDQEVIKSEKTVLVDFWAPWCAPCLAMNPIIDDLTEKFAGQIIVGKINVDENKVITEKYGIMSVPNIKIFQKGKVVKEFFGKQNFETLNSELNNFCEEKNDSQKMNESDENNDMNTGCSCGCNC